mmetsp:Transcript_5847/g.9710  ORF Transcript_5847/g.9710 Transcript_5847/m.9710 type:complete len:343 (-) Transcript_5847:291-1319(-)
MQLHNKKRHPHHGKDRNDNSPCVRKGFHEDKLLSNVYCALCWHKGMKRIVIQLVSVVVLCIVMHDRHTLFGANLEGFLGVGIDNGWFISLIKKDGNGSHGHGSGKGVVMRLSVRALFVFVHEEISVMRRGEARDLFDSLFDSLVGRHLPHALPQHGTFDLVQLVNIVGELQQGILRHWLHLLFSSLNQQLTFLWCQDIVNQIQGGTLGCHIFKEGTVATGVETDAIRHAVIDHVLGLHLCSHGSSRQNIGRIVGNHHDWNIDSIRILALGKFEAINIIRVFLVDIDHNQSSSPALLGNLSHLPTWQTGLVGHNDHVSVHFFSVIQNCHGFIRLLVHTSKGFG